MWTEDTKANALSVNLTTEARDCACAQERVMGISHKHY